MPGLRNCDRARSAALAGWALGGVLLLLAPPALVDATPLVNEEAFSGLSREMRLGIQFYQKGDDLQAMDRFMEVLTRGDPAERSIANEYINLINRRMNRGELTPDRPPTLRPNEAVAEPVAGRRPVGESVGGSEVLVEGAGELAAAGSLAARGVVPADGLGPLRAAASAGYPAASRELMKKEIRAKIRSLLEAGLRALKNDARIQLLMMENGDPQAVAIPSSALFQSGIGFQKDAVKILDALTKVVFGLGSAQVIVLPEGTPQGDAKILDMRRTMGVSAHLYSAGVAAPRVRVNLLNTQVDIPKPLLDFHGVIVLFVYSAPMNLEVENALADDGGPPLSLGIYPPAIRADRDDGSIIEFSVQDPPAGLASWKFQLLQPTPTGGRDLAPLQEVVGGSPVFHQIYWNGRQGYFGPPLPAGRYECVLTATDGKNRQRTLHRWLLVQDTGGAMARPAPKGAPASDLAGRPDSLLKETSRPVLKVQLAPKGGKRAPPRRAARRRPLKAPARKARARRPVKRAAHKPAAPQARAPVKTEASDHPIRPAPEDLELEFNKGTHQLTAAGERNLAQIAEWMTYYPLENVRLTGYAERSEQDAANLAEHRAQMVAGLLINKYQIDPKKIEVTSSVSEVAAYKVDVTFQKAP